MRAAVFQGDGRSSIEDRPGPEPGPGEVLVALEGCGICASNLPAWQGRPWFRYPLEAGAPGHEPWGRVVACGDGVRGLEAGMRVTGLSWRAYAQHDLARAEHLVIVPERYDGLPIPGEALACGMNVFLRCAIEPGLRIAVVGAGFIGGLAVQLAHAAGARVTAFSRRRWSRERAREQGAVAAHPIGEGTAAEHEGSWPCVVECTGTQAGLDLASKLVAVRGRLVIAGYHQEGLRSVDMQDWNWKGIDVINAHERDPARYVAGLAEALAAMDRKELEPWPLFTHRFGLEAIDEAFRLMQDAPEGYTKALLCL